jgi:hypothetical protein
MSALLADWAHEGLCAEFRRASLDPLIQQQGLRLLKETPSSAPYAAWRNNSLYVFGNATSADFTARAKPTPSLRSRGRVLPLYSDDAEQVPVQVPPFDSVLLTFATQRRPEAESTRAPGAPAVSPDTWQMLLPFRCPGINRTGKRAHHCQSARARMYASTASAPSRHPRFFKSSMRSARNSLNFSRPRSTTNCSSTSATAAAVLASDNVLEM